MPIRLLSLTLGCALASPFAFAQTHPLAQLIESARQGPSAPGLAEQITKILTAKGGTAVWGADYLFVTPSASPATLSIDMQPALPMAQVGGSNLWMRLVKMRVGVTHAYQFYADGKPLGTRSDVAGYNPDSYPKPGVPQGKLSEKHTIASKIYDGMKADYWFYASPGVDPQVPAPLMIWQDGQGLIAGDLSKLRLFTVTENLIAQKLIPPDGACAHCTRFCSRRQTHAIDRIRHGQRSLQPLPSRRGAARSREIIQAAPRWL